MEEPLSIENPHHSHLHFWEKSSAALLVFCLSLVLFGLFFREHYSIDLYYVSSDLLDCLGTHLRNGRLISLLLYFILFSLGFDFSSHIALQSFLLCLSVAVSAVAVSDELFSYGKRKSFGIYLILTLFVSTAYCNCFFSEWFCFTECALMYAAAILSSAYAAVCLCRGKRTAAFLLAFCCYNSYQVALAYFVFWFMLLTAVKYDFRLERRSIREIAFAAFLCALVVLVNMVMVTTVYNLMLYTGRYSSITAGSLLENMSGAVDLVKAFFMNGNSLIDGPWLAIVAALLAGIVVFRLIRGGITLSSVVFLVLILLGGSAVIMLPQLIVELWAPPRTLVPLFAGYSVVLIFLLSFSGTRKQIFVLLIPAVLLLLVNISASWSFERDVLLSNSYDRAFAEEVCSRIEEYEAETGAEVTTVSVGLDAAPSWFWDIGDEYRWSLCTRACMTEWADVSSINYFTGRAFQRLKMSEMEKQMYFSDTNWSELDLDEQLVLDGNTAYLLIY